MELEGWRWEVVEEVRLQLGEREVETEKVEVKEKKKAEGVDAGEMVGESGIGDGGKGVDEIEGFSRDEGGQ